MLTTFGRPIATFSCLSCVMLVRESVPVRFVTNNSKGLLSDGKEKVTRTRGTPQGGVVHYWRICLCIMRLIIGLNEISSTSGLRDMLMMH